MIVSEGFAKGNVKIESVGNLNLQRVMSSNGSLSATSTNGNVLLLPLGFIDAKQGVTVKTNSSTGIISFGPNTSVHSSTGPITIQIGAGLLAEVRALPGTINNIAYQPSGGSINIPQEDTGGQNRILGQQINVVRAERSSISLRPGSSGQIELNGQVRISIDDTEMHPAPPPRPPLIPISFSTQKAYDNFELCHAVTSCANIWSKAKGAVSCTNNLLQVTKGEMLIEAKSDSVVLIDSIKVELDKLAILQVLACGDTIVLRNLFDGHSGSVIVRAGTAEIALEPGQELIFGNDGYSSTAYRNRRELITHQGQIVTREFSLLSLHSAGELLALMRASENPKAQMVLSKMEKLYACLMLVRTNKGPFSRR